MEPRDEGEKARGLAGGPAGKGRVDPGEVAGLDLSTQVGLRRLVCAGFCTFYRDEVKEEMACAGLAAVAAVLAAGPGPSEAPSGARVAAPTAAPAGAPGVSGTVALLTGLLASQEPVSYAHDAELLELVCRRCEFLPDGGCDHRNPDLPAAERLEPCGGYVVLAAWLARA